MNWIVEYQTNCWKEIEKTLKFAVKLPKTPYFFHFLEKKSFLNQTLGLRKSFLNQTTYVLKNRLHLQSSLNRDSFLNWAFLNRECTVLVEISFRKIYEGLTNVMKANLTYLVLDWLQYSVLIYQGIERKVLQKVCCKLRVLDLLPSAHGSTWLYQKHNGLSVVYSAIGNLNNRYFTCFN